MHPVYAMSYREDYWLGTFNAMASPCEILVDTARRDIAEPLIALGAQEAHRIELKFSRYRQDNIIHRINTANGVSIEVDAETAQLLDFASQCYKLSDGMFDITSGVLRRAWKFDGSDRLPTQEQIAVVLPFVGWLHAEWKHPCLTLPVGMEIDLGGIGKEYAVDRVARELVQRSPVPVLVNFGGDVAATGVRCNGQMWSVGIENPQHMATAASTMRLGRGGVATSGDSRRYLMKDGIRYGHILNPKTGWPVQPSPRSITVVADNCTEAGLLATLAMLQGDNAVKFLSEQSVQFWCLG